jgi:hypothetical protein
MTDTIDDAGTGGMGTDAADEEQSGRRLPPPAFPPGRGGPRSGTVREADPGELGEALISPTDPRPVRAPEVEEDDALPTEIDPDDVMVTGMGHDPRLDPLEVVLAEDPPVMEVVETVGRLAEALKLRGKAALRVTPGMSTFESTLRAYCVGYLAGRRAEDDQS